MEEERKKRGKIGGNEEKCVKEGGKKQRGKGERRKRKGEREKEWGEREEGEGIKVEKKNGVSFQTFRYRQRWVPSVI